MQIKISGKQIHLARYSGSSKDGDSRKTLTARIGSFPADVLPEFNTISGVDKEKCIPIKIYRSTTPDEHDLIIAFVRDLRLSELMQRVQQTTTELREIEQLIPDARLDPVDAKSLLNVCTTIAKLLRKTLTPVTAKIKHLNAQVPDLDRETLNGQMGEASPISPFSTGNKN